MPEKMPVDYREAVEYIEELPRFTRKHPLEHTKEFMKRLGNPAHGCKVIHVAGTNGKGSVCAYIQAILQAEGNCQDQKKNVDESFKIVNKLDLDKFEIVYLSYGSQVKDWYHIDKCLNKVPHSKVGRVYQECDILLKSSVLESFSYPPLEMMATGGINVVVQNDGNREYLQDEYNCVFYKQGDIEDAVEKINHVLHDKELRDKLIVNGVKTAEKRSWENAKKDIVALYQWQ